MNFELWLAFVAAYTLISLIPGPSVFMIMSQALTSGRSAAFFCIFGDVLGGICLMCLSFLGMGAILATSTVLFQALKWAGVLYMAYLGYCQISEARRGSSPRYEKGDRVSYRGNVGAGFLVGILNPKAIAFYLAFLSQFMDPSQALLPQFLILVATSSAVVIIVLSGYALIAARARDAFQTASARRRFGYAGGSCLIGGSMLMAVTR